MTLSPLLFVHSTSICPSSIKLLSLDRKVIDMPSIGPMEILLILIVALVVFGPRKLPELGKSLGSGLREFRRSTQGLKEEFENNIREPIASASDAAQGVETSKASKLDKKPVSAQAVTPQPVQQKQDV